MLILTADIAPVEKKVFRTFNSGQLQQNAIFNFGKYLCIKSLSCFTQNSWN